MATASDIEDSIRKTAEEKRIRSSEFFLDFDKLRSGFVTVTQFFRVLRENLGVKLNDEEQRVLTKKYDLKKNGRMNYRLFCDAVSPPFNPNDLSSDPGSRTNVAQQTGNSPAKQVSVDEVSDAKLEALLCRLAKYYQYRGINLRTSCEDFDWHHIGVIEESQFYRSFPRPPEVKEEDIDLLVRKYRDPSRQGLINYLNLHQDLEATAQCMKDQDSIVVVPNNDVSKFLPRLPGADATLQQVFDKVRVAVFKNGVRTIEFFKDYDKLRSGIITENQFVCGLSLAVGKEAQLSRPEIQKVVEFYRMADGRVRYKEFCDMMENAFNIPDLEKKPMVNVVRPPAGVLGRNLPVLSDAEESRVLEVLNLLSEQVQKRRLMMYPYFKDYDRSKGYSRVVTSTQFGRILHFLSLNVKPEDFKLLIRKFADPQTQDINYPAFVQAVDREFTNYTQDTEMIDQKPLVQIQPENKAADTAVPISLDHIMARIRHHVLINRRRVCEFFQDFDQLRSGSITRSQFRRGLSDLGLSALGQHNLTESQFQLLSSHYQNPNMPDKILWTVFMDDLESVFTQKELEKYPRHQVPPLDIYLVPKSGTVDWKYATEDHYSLVAAVMDRLRQRTNQRRVLAKPVFQDFDRHNNGHVTRHQFRQCLTILELHCTEAEMQALEAKFCNDTGFNYLAFLSELEPQEPPKLMYVERLKEIRQANQKSVHPESYVATDMESVMKKIKTKVYKERIRVLEWMRDYDKLRSGRILKANFRRALDLCTFELNQSETAILEDHYAAYGYPDHIDYIRFSDDVESLFTTKNLEKDPLMEVNTFKPQKEWEQNLEPELESVVGRCMERLAEKVRKTRMQLFPLFEDYDKVHNGTVSRSQFRRVLTELELASLVATEQEWISLYRKFDLKVGGKDDVNYIAFCDMIYALAKFESRKP